MELPYRKTIRLPREAYDQPDATWLVTVTVLNRRSTPFSNSELSRATVDCIEQTIREDKLQLFIGCLMPDHLHLVINTNGRNLIDVMEKIKSLTTKVWWRHGKTAAIWQRSFHDEGLRTTYDFDRGIDYVLRNPVEEGLVTDWRDYPFMFSNVIDGLTPGAAPSS